ncbi:MAG: MmcQ/YjbR family DNA-binding protein [Saprospiraceae bacterium]|nr:MmcQ/YjbR family DNA-binding protein [Saprospiraceae bacterium]HRG37322.1 MmcQ/YjbR family DNA-binding protein [Bacteroidia bacterium]
MNIESFRNYCLSLDFVEEGFPFGPDTLVFKVKSKIFAITSLNAEFLKVNLKSDPVKAIVLREQYEEIQPGFHMNKKHWNTVNFESRLSDKFLKELINDSYKLVCKSLPLKDRF